MKKLVFILCALLLNCSSDNDADWSGLFSAGPTFPNGIDLPYVSISDQNFEMYLETHDSNGNVVDIGDANSMGDGSINGQVPDDKVENVTQLNISNLEIDTLFGISGFESLQHLDCSNNRLVNIDVSYNPDLTVLNFDNNNLVSFDASGIENLISVSCVNNLLTSINLSRHNELEVFDVSNNFLTSLSLSLNGRLKNVNCSNNLIEVLTIINNPDLEILNCKGNNLETLNLSNNHNSDLVFMNTVNNPNLQCIKVDDNFSPTDCGLPQEEIGWCKDDTAFYSVDCN